MSRTLRCWRLTVEDCKTFLADHEGAPTSICRHPHGGCYRCLRPRRQIARLGWPTEIDLVYPAKGDLKGPVVPGIYQFEGDLLKIATGFGREERKTRPKSFEDKSGLFILILKKGEPRAK
ncbi:MAG TPA: hypothetical protein VEL76_29930 [Gemmataceae bacterium]|nr:hypothetical protein [Gemmataceae bacterium]